MKENVITKEGLVIESLPDLLFRVQLEDERVINAKIAGKLRMNRIKILPGDTVTVELTPYDENRGRIVWRGKKR